RSIGQGRPGCRSADGSGDEGARGLESPRANRRAQSLPGCGDHGKPSAQRQWTAIAAPVNHATKTAGPGLRAVYVAPERVAGDLSALSGERLARKIRAAGHARSAHSAGQGQSVCGAKTPALKIASPSRRLQK